MTFSSLSSASAASSGLFCFFSRNMFPLATCFPASIKRKTRARRQGRSEIWGLSGPKAHRGRWLIWELVKPTFWTGYQFRYSEAPTEQAFLQSFNQAFSLENDMGLRAVCANVQKILLILLRSLQKLRTQTQPKIVSQDPAAHCRRLRSTVGPAVHDGVVALDVTFEGALGALPDLRCRGLTRPGQ